jgi:hypothetical protein
MYARNQNFALAATICRLSFIILIPENMPLERTAALFVR